MYTIFCSSFAALYTPKMHEIMEMSKGVRIFSHECANRGVGG